MDISIEALGTVAGASAAAIIITNFAKQLLNLSRIWVRRVSLIVGFVAVEGATLLANWDAISSGQDLPTVIGQLALAGVVGAQAGLAANAGFDTAKTGAGYEVYATGEGIGEGL